MAAREQRKTVTVLFCDLAGSTALGEALDPERLRALLARYYERMQGIVERHGGSVEKFVGDAVMVVFGVPVLHEDDAMRAVRTAAEMRDALPELELEGRIGVMTGTVVAGTDEHLATGDAVNVAARLEKAAQSGEVLIGEPTFALVREAVDVEPVEPLVLKGKAERVPAYRLLRVREAPERPQTNQFVGREHELESLRAAFAHVVSDQRCELITVVGEPGVGKSRLSAELLTSIDARVIRGRCLPYGDGVTYWPVVEVLKQVGLLPPEPAAAAAIRSLLGEDGGATSPEEIAWAFRKTLERVAAERPLVVVFDDIQWGEQTFLDLIEHVGLLASGAPILLLCLARLELAQHRPAWPITFRLEPLPDDDVDQLIPGRIEDELRDRIASAAGGNPLFVEEMVAMAAETDGEVAVPPTLQALLAARLDQLETPERSVLERGSIEGETFHRGAVQSLALDETPVTPQLAALVRKELIRPDTPQLRGEDGFRFRHLLIRDAAYDALPKATRADLHARFASWLEEHGTELVELEELLGYHLEQTCRYRSELGLPDDGELTSAARRHLTAAGHRAQLRSDYGAAVNLLQRAASLVRSDQLDLALETSLVDALFWAGRGREAIRRADSIADRASAAGDEVGELCGRIQAGIVGMWLEPEGATQPLTALAEEALPVFESAGDDVALYTAFRALAQAGQMRGQFDAALRASERAATHARLAGLTDYLFAWHADFIFGGTMPVSGLLTWLDEHERPGGDHWLRAFRAVALAMLGRFDEARGILAEGRAALAERGGGLLLASITGIFSTLVERWADDPAAAVELGLEGCRLLDELGEKGIQSTASGILAQAFYELDRLEDAEAWAGRAAQLGASEDAPTQLLFRGVTAKVLARRGEHSEAERTARAAVALGEETDMIDAQGDAYLDLAEVLQLAGKADEATAALEEALGRYERKGNLAMAGRTRDRLAVLAA